MTSVIIPSYNRFDWLLDAIDSAKMQNNCEIIVVDDGSTDERYNRTDWESLGVFYFRNESKGVSSARNLGMQVASGKWVAFLDDDDLWLPDKIKTQIENLDGCLMSSTEGYYGTDPRPEVKNYPLYFRDRYSRFVTAKTGYQALPRFLSGKDLRYGNVIVTSSVLVDKELALSCGGFRMDPLTRCEDWPLWKKCLEKTDCSFVNKPLFYYNDSPRERVAVKRELDED